METIGYDCIKLILLYSDYNDLIKWRCVNKKFKEIIEDLDHAEIDMYISCLQNHQIAIKKLLSGKLDNFYIRYVQNDKYKNLIVTPSIRLDQFKSMNIPDIENEQEIMEDEIFQNIIYPETNLQQHKITVKKLLSNNSFIRYNYEFAISKLYADLLDLNNITMAKLILTYLKPTIKYDDYYSNIIQKEFKKETPNVEKIKLLSLNNNIINATNNYEKVILNCVNKYYQYDIAACLIKALKYEHLLFKRPMKWTKVIEYFVKNNINIEYNGKKLVNYCIEEFMNMKLNEGENYLYTYGKQWNRIKPRLDIIELIINNDDISIIKEKSFFNDVENKCFKYSQRGTVQLPYSYNMEKYNLLVDTLKYKINISKYIMYKLTIKDEYIKYTNNKTITFYYLDNLINYIREKFESLRRSRQYSIGTKVIIGALEPEYVGDIEFLGYTTQYLYV